MSSSTKAIIVGASVLGVAALIYLASKSDKGDKKPTDNNNQESVAEPEIASSHATKISLPANAQFGVWCTKTAPESTFTFKTIPGSEFDSDIVVSVCDNSISAYQLSGGKIVDMGKSPTGVSTTDPFHIQIDYGELTITQADRILLNCLPVQLRSNMQAGPYSEGVSVGGYFIRG